MSVRVSSLMEHLGSHWTDLKKKKLYCSMFRNAVDKIQVSLNSDKNNGTLYEDHNTFFLSYRSHLLLE